MFSPVKFTSMAYTVGAKSLERREKFRAVKQILPPTTPTEILGYGLVNAQSISCLTMGMSDKMLGNRISQQLPPKKEEFFLSLLLQ